MPRTSYQYETSPRKYEPEYTTNRIKKKKVETKRIQKNKNDIKKNEKNKKIAETKSKAKKIVLVMAIFGMLLAVSYREISIMEMFNQKKKLEDKLSVVEKENGQVEKSIKEEESKLDWNNIKSIATEQLGMERKSAIPVDLEKSDNIQIENKFIKEEKTNILEKIISFIINR